MDEQQVPPARDEWIVWRMDETGNQFVVQERLSQQAADRLVEQFTARGHKQTYWAERRK